MLRIHEYTLIYKASQLFESKQILLSLQLHPWELVLYSRERAIFMQQKTTFFFRNFLQKATILFAKCVRRSVCDMRDLLDNSPRSQESIDLPSSFLLLHNLVSFQYCFCRTNPHCMGNAALQLHIHPRC